MMWWATYVDVNKCIVRGEVMDNAQKTCVRVRGDCTNNGNA